MDKILVDYCLRACNFWITVLRINLNSPGTLKRLWRLGLANFTNKSYDLSLKIGKYFISTIKAPSQVVLQCSLVMPHVLRNLTMTAGVPGKKMNFHSLPQYKD